RTFRRPCASTPRPQDASPSRRTGSGAMPPAAEAMWSSSISKCIRGSAISFVMAALEHAVAGKRRMQHVGRLSFETGALILSSHPRASRRAFGAPQHEGGCRRTRAPQDEAELAQHVFLTLRRPRSGRLEG